MKVNLIIVALVLCCRIGFAQPYLTPVNVTEEGFIAVDTALIRQLGLRSITIRDAGNNVFCFFKYNDRNQPVAEYRQSNYTLYTYDNRNRLTLQVTYKNIGFKDFAHVHDIDSTFISYPTDSSVRTVVKEYQTGGERNNRNETNNREYYLLPYSQVRSDLVILPMLPVYSYPNGAKRLPPPPDPYVLDEKFKTNYSDTTLYRVKQTETVLVKGLTTFYRVDAEMDVAFTPPPAFHNGDWCGTSHDMLPHIFSERIARYNADHLISDISQHDYSLLTLYDKNKRVDDQNDKTYVLYWFSYTYR